MFFNGQHRYTPVVSLGGTSKAVSAKNAPGTCAPVSNVWTAEPWLMCTCTIRRMVGGFTFYNRFSIIGQNLSQVFVFSWRLSYAWCSNVKKTNLPWKLHLDVPYVYVSKMTDASIHSVSYYSAVWCFQFLRYVSKCDHFPSLHRKAVKPCLSVWRRSEESAMYVLHPLLLFSGLLKFIFCVYFIYHKHEKDMHVNERCIWKWILNSIWDGSKPSTVCCGLFQQMFHSVFFFWLFICCGLFQQMVRSSFFWLYIF